jgi:single-stranded-DNA-specific exonuclease
MEKIIQRRVFPQGNDGFTALLDSSLHPLLAQIYSSRGVTSPTDLDLQLSNLLPPSELLNADRAAVLLADALSSNKNIVIIGDFDADGATSTTLAVSALRAFGARHVRYLVPNRFEYGYGLTPEIVELAKRDSPDVIVTVDNGISSIEGVFAAKAAGIVTLVTDHHLPGKELPAAQVIVNPNQAACGFPSKNLAGVGVIFYVMLALRVELRRRDWFVTRGNKEPNLAEYLDLVALGTVADVVPLDVNNRILVSQGLARIRAGRARLGIVALLQAASRNYRTVVASDLGFSVGPRLNAAGRLDDMSVGIECLLSETHSAAAALATRLDTFNRDRRVIEQDMQREAAAALDQLQLDDDSQPPLAISLYQAGWHQGVIGILASRVKERFHRPTIVFADGDAGQIKGSARSIPGIHIRDILDAIASRYPGLILKFGGHAMAAGLSMEKNAYEKFAAAFVAEVALHVEDVNLQASIESDGELEERFLALDLANELRFAGPWGQHFPEPIFDGHFSVVQQRIVGEKHLKLVLSLPGSDQLLDAIAFNVNTEVWPDESIETVKLAYRLDVNEFRGKRSLQLMVDNITPL